MKMQNFLQNLHFWLDLNLETAIMRSISWNSWYPINNILDRRIHMANIIPFIRFTALENVEFVGFSSIVGVTNIVTIQTGYDDLESIGC